MQWPNGFAGFARLGPNGDLYLFEEADHDYPAGSPRFFFNLLLGGTKISI